jgi:hypothetical protein
MSPGRPTLSAAVPHRQAGRRTRSPHSPRMPVLLAICALSGAPLIGESVTFYFAPPANSAFQARRLQVSETQIGATREELTLAMLETLRVRQEAGRTYVASRIDKIAAAKEKKPIDMPAAIEAMQGSEIVRVFGLDGTLQRILGNDRMAARALPSMTGETRRSLEKYLAEGRQDDRDRADWYEVEVLLGQTLELDRDYWFEAAWPDESGWITHHTLVRLGPWVDHPGARLLTVHLAYVANAEAAMPRATHLVPRVLSRFNARQPGTLKPKLKLEGAATWLMDPATSVVWRNQSRRKVSEPWQVSEDLAVTIVTEEKIDLTLEPLAAPATMSTTQP